MKIIKICSQDVKREPDASGWWMYQRVGWYPNVWDFVMVGHELNYFWRMMDRNRRPLPETDEPGRWIGPIEIEHGSKRA